MNDAPQTALEALTPPPGLAKALAMSSSTSRRAARGSAAP